jgi:hypothetical protein
MMDVINRVISRLFPKIIIFVSMIHFRVKKLDRLLKVFILVVLSCTATAQTGTKLRKTFKEAESHFLFGEYELALPLYLNLEKPDNYNIKYKIGVCRLNILGEKDKATPYLEAAALNSDFSAKTNSFKEKRAPLDAYFFLARSYMINNELEKAIETFNIFKTIASEVKDKGSMKNADYIDQEIKACRNAIANEGDPFRISKRLLGKEFSHGKLNEDPAVSFDGNTIVYTESNGFANSIMYSRKINGKWQPPEKINSQLNSGEDCSSCSLNKDGTLLYLYKTDNFDGNIYSSELLNGSWTPVKKLNSNINTKFYESHASISPDNNTLYFTSNREGGKGGLDIYISTRDASGDWGPAVNAGDIINTPYNEDDPFITLNDSILYFSSEGHDGMGGYDIFRSLKQGNSWGNPVNLGFPLNSTDDDRFFQPWNNDENGYYSMVTGNKKKEIYYITLTSARLNKVYEIKGKYGLKDTVSEFGENNSIYLIDRISGDTLDTSHPEDNTGSYNFITSPGIYRVLYTGPPGYYSQVIDTTITKENPSKVIELQDVILDTSPKTGNELAYEKIDLSKIPVVSEVNPDILIKDVQAMDIGESDSTDASFLYYTVQVMALHNPVDVNYFKHVNDIKVLFNEGDQFYRYITGQFRNKDDAYSHKAALIAMGYPEDLFIKKITRISDEQQVNGKKYFTIQIKAVKTPLDIDKYFNGLREVKEVKEMDGLYHYLYGRYSSTVNAGAALRRVKNLGYTDAFVREINIILEK